MSEEEDQARAYREWLKTGEIPEWRKAQLVQEAIDEAIAQAREGITDPRGLGGDISGPGGPLDFGEQVIDTSKAILADYQEVAKIDPERGARGRDDVFAVLIEGRINQTQERAKVMFLGDIDFLAALITQIHGVCERASPEHAQALTRRCQERWNEMPHP